MLKIIFKTVLMCFIAGSVFAEDNVNVPADELTQETVYPVFDNPVSVKNRNIQDSGVMDLGVFGGLAITEPISNTTKFGISANYHFSETHSFGILYAKNSTGLSKDAQGLKTDFGLDFNRAPYPEYTLMGDYNFKAFYGKLSIMKDGVVNTSIYGSFAGGVVKYIHKSYPALAIGVGERFYFGHHWSLKVDLRLYAHQAPVPFKTGALRDGSGPGGLDPIPAYDSFSERLTYTTNLEVGLNYLF